MKRGSKMSALTVSKEDEARVKGMGFLNNRLYHIPPSEQYAIVLKSNYGEIGGKVWKGFGVIRASAGKIKLPGHYLLSVLNN